MAVTTGIVETCLYVKNLNRAKQFYLELFGFESLAEDHRFCAFSVCGNDVLLLFREGASDDDLQTPGGVIPSHGAAGETHIAFGINSSEIDAWKTKLAELGVTIESIVAWPRGGTSLYFRDPDSNLIELMTPGVWRVY